MSTRDLKMELKKRDLCRDGKKAEVVHRLKVYLDSEEVRDALAKPFMLGYCRRMERGLHKMNISCYLKQVVVEYFGYGIPSLYQENLEPRAKCIKPSQDVAFTFLKV